MSLTVDSKTIVSGADKTFTVTDSVSGWLTATPKIVISRNRIDTLFEFDGTSDVEDDWKFTFAITDAQGKTYMSIPGKYYVRVWHEDADGDRTDRGEINLFVDAGPGAA